MTTQKLEMQIQATPQSDGQTIAVLITFGPMQQAVLIPANFMSQFISVLQKALEQVPRVVVPTIVGMNGKSQA